MGGWRHDNSPHSSVLYGCYAPVQTGETPTPSGCTTPTPDPASPCGRLLVDEDLLGVEFPCGWPETGIVHDRHHPHRPTTCAACGHGIVEAP